MFYAQEVFERDIPSPNGASTGAQLRQVERVMGDSLLLGPMYEIPVEVEYLWRLFLALNETRSSGFGPNPICFTEIANWGRLHSVVLEPWEIDIIRRLDHVWMLVVKDKMAPPKK